MSLYLDANASYGLTEYVREELLRSGLYTGNPNSVHGAGQKTRALIEEARARIAQFLGVGADARIIFTSGATEANTFAILQAFDSIYSGGVSGSVVTTAVEHPSVLEVCAALKQRKAQLRIIAPRQGSLFDLKDFENTVEPDSKLVSVMCVNNETGQILPVRRIVEVVKKKNKNTLVHTDAVQALGKIPLNFAQLGVDLMSISAHKIGGLAGVGALIVRRSVPMDPLFIGGPQETHLRAGTENVAGIISFGAAIEELTRTMLQRVELMKERAEQLLTLLRHGIPTLFVNASDSERVPNTLSLRIPGIRADDLVVALDGEGVQISSGAACASGKPEPSHVLIAIGLHEAEARESIRISLRGCESRAEIEEAAEKIVQCVARMKGSL